MTVVLESRVFDRMAVDRQLAPYAVLVAGGVTTALVTGLSAFAAAAVPAAVLLGLALAGGRAPKVGIEFGDTPARLLEGDEWTLSVALSWDGAAEVDLVLTDVAGHEILDRGAVLVGDGGAHWTARLRADRWGRHELGMVTLRVRRPGGVFVRDVAVPVPGRVRVLPSARRLDSLVHPVRPRAAAGAHAAPTRGPGTDFADLRPYAPGDRLRDLSWSASARTDRPWVIDHHPDRTGTIVLLLDVFTETGVPPEALDRAARAVWSLSRHHLANGDRVGLLAAGPTPRWLPPVAGRRSRWQVLDALLSVRSRERGPSATTHAVPADAFVVGVSPLQSDAFVAAVVHHRRIGRPTAVLAVEVADLLPPPGDDVERAARRLWALDADLRRANLSRAGVRTVGVADDVAAAVRALSRLPHRTLVQAR